MRKIAFLILVMFTVVIAKAQDGWITYKVDDKVSVKFPGEPMKSNNEIAFRDKYDLQYSISSEDLVAHLGIDSTRLAEDQKTQDFLDFLKKRISTNLHSGVIEDFKIDNWKGYTSYRSVITGTSRKAKMYIFMVLIGNKMYSLTAILYDYINPGTKEGFFHRSL